MLGTAYMTDMDYRHVSLRILTLLESMRQILPSFSGQVTQLAKNAVGIQTLLLQDYSFSYNNLLFH